MVDTTNNLALRTLLGAQNAPSQNSLSALKNNKQARQAIMAPFQQNNAPKEFATSLSKASTAIADAAASSLPSNLPRGSLVNLLV